MTAASKPGKLFGAAFSFQFHDGSNAETDNHYEYGDHDSHFSLLSVLRSNAGLISMFCHTSSEPVLFEPFMFGSSIFILPVCHLR